MAVDAAPHAASPALAPRLRAVYAGLREDLEVTRHVFRGEASYVIRDPLTFQSQRLGPADYDILVRLTPGKPLAHVYDQLVRERKLTPADEEEFYQFILNLHRLGFLRLPMSDDKQLYRRFVAKRTARRKEALLGFLFLRIPLVNPDAFLTRTMHLVRPLFSRAALLSWALLMAAALFVAAGRRAELALPLDGLLAARNLPLIWITLIVLKLFHELGHAYACKHYGGHVPEMGAYLIVFTPCAYVDATACWGFTRKWERLVVCFAGMYVESFFAAAALLIWSLTEPSLVNSLAYNVIFIAGAVTVLFNINPLMRYDGYYILSDLLEVPNLRARATRHVVDLLKRHCLGLRIPAEAEPRRLRAILLFYGVAAALYRIALVLGIAALLATKVFILGLSLAAFYVAHAALGILSRLYVFLWKAPETAAIRWRAAAVTAALFLVFPAAAFFTPLPATVRAAGVIGASEESVIRAPASGFVKRVARSPGHRVEVDGSLVELLSDELESAALEAEAALRGARLREDARRERDPARALAERDRVDAAEQHRQHARAELERLHVRSPIAGELVDGLREQDVGRYLARGEPLAVVASGHWRVRAMLTQEQMAACRPRVNQPAEFRSVAEASRTVHGRIARIAPAGSRRIEHPSLTQQGGGDIAVEAATGEAAQPFFELAIDIPRDRAPHFRHGMTGLVRLPAAPEPLATRVARRIERFVAKLYQQQS